MAYDELEAALIELLWKNMDQGFVKLVLELLLNIVFGSKDRDRYCSELSKNWLHHSWDHAKHKSVLGPIHLRALNLRAEHAITIEDTIGHQEGNFSHPQENIDNQVEELERVKLKMRRKIIENLDPFAEEGLLVLAAYIIRHRKSLHLNDLPTKS